LGLAVGFRRVLVVVAFNSDFVLPASHLLLEHKSVHVDVGGEASAVAGVGDTTVFELFFGGPCLLHFLYDIFVSFDSLLLADFLLNNCLHPLLVF